MDSTRRRLGLPLIATFLAAAGARAQAPGSGERLVLGEGSHRFAWVPGWAAAAQDHFFGNTHGGIVIDEGGRIYVNTDTERAVMVFKPDGTLVGCFGEEWQGGLHSMLIRKEDGRELLYVAHHAKGEVAKLTLKGETVWTLGWPEASGLYARREEYHPTAVAVAPDGRLYVADGYGKSYVHVYDAARRYLRSFGGPGTEPGKMQTPHGLWLDTRRATPRLLVADRENHRLQAFDLDGNHLAVIDADLRRPCAMHQHGTDLAVADLAGRVTILDAEDRVVCHLGDQPDPAQRANNGVPKAQWKDGFFLAPHAVCFDQGGNLYVMDWVALGRVTRLDRLR